MQISWSNKREVGCTYWSVNKGMMWQRLTSGGSTRYEILHNPVAGVSHNQHFKYDAWINLIEKLLLWGLNCILLLTRYIFVFTAGWRCHTSHSGWPSWGPLLVLLWIPKWDLELSGTWRTHLMYEVHPHKYTHASATYTISELHRANQTARLWTCRINQFQLMSSWENKKETHSLTVTPLQFGK